MWIKRDILVTVASWEERFLLGFQRILEQTTLTSSIILYSEEYAEWTKDARRSVAEICADKGVGITWGTLFAGDPQRSWNETLAPSFGGVASGSSAIVDISTMPREVIWQSLWFLNCNNCNVGFVYHRPGEYGDWLSRDPDRPRLVYKMSGIARLGTKTALLILAGYDVDRVKHLVEVFEPSLTILGIQEDNVDPLNSERMKAVQDAFEGDGSVSTFMLDAFSDDHGRSAIEAALESVRDSHNVIMASMGPKLSGLALYEVHVDNEHLGLVYLPSREFNKDYSKGIGESIWGDVHMSG